jgi:hypothetical protein
MHDPAAENIAIGVGVGWHRDGANGQLADRHDGLCSDIHSHALSFHRRPIIGLPENMYAAALPGVSRRDQQGCRRMRAT